MEDFFKTHAYLVGHTNAPVRRKLMDEIDWSERMIGIKGTRGVGKTTFLLQYAKEAFDVKQRKCLYVNMNNFYFQGRGIEDFAGEFYSNGGRVLLIDQVFKEPDWSKELRRCYDKYPELKIVFTGSSVMRLKEENPELNGIVHSYNLRGFSLREFVNLLSGNEFPAVSFSDIMDNAGDIASDIESKVSIEKYFANYLRYGFYPFFLENRNFSENLLKTMNMMTEVDILLIKQIGLKHLHKIKKLFYLIAQGGLKAPNISDLASQTEISRATAMNYIKYLADARLINIIYAPDEEFPKKPARIMMYNTNLSYVIYPIKDCSQDIMETFVVNNLWKDHHVSVCGKSGSYIVDNKDKISIRDAVDAKKAKQADSTLNVVYNGDCGTTDGIPVWLFGFLY